MSYPTKEELLGKPCPTTGCTNKAQVLNIVGAWSVMPCQKCKEESNALPPIPKPHDFTTDEIRDARKSHKKQLLQPWRGGEISKEYLDAYPEQKKEMVKQGVITQKQADTAKEVWKGVV